MASDQISQTTDVDQASARLVKRLEGLLAATRRSNRVTLIVGVVLAVVIAGYMHLLIVSPIEEYVHQPSTIAVLVRQSAERQVPEVVRQLKTGLKKSAPEMVRDMRIKAVKALPGFRAEFEKQLVEAAAKEVRAVLQANLDKLVNDMLKDQKEKLDPIIAKATDDDGVRKLTEEFEKVFSDGLGKPLKDVLDKGKFTQNLKGMSDYLRRLRTAKDLTPKEAYEKTVVEDFMNTLAHIVHKTAKDPTGDPAFKLAPSATPAKEATPKPAAKDAPVRPAPPKEAPAKPSAK
jgi:hypothetical protein